MGAQSSKHAEVLEAVANNDDRQLRAIFSDKSVSPLLLIYVLSQEDVDAVFPHQPKLFEKRPQWKGRSPLHFAAEQKDTRILKAIVALLKDCPDKRLEFSAGKTLYFVDFWGTRDQWGHSPLSHAVRTENVRAITVLAEAGAKLDAAYSALKDDRENNACWSYVRYAAVNGLHSALAALLDSGADCKEWGRDGRRPLHLAVAAGQIECVKELLRRDMDNKPRVERGEEADCNGDDNSQVANDGERVREEREERSDPKRLRAIAKYFVRESNVGSADNSSTGDSVSPRGRSEEAGGADESEGTQVLNALRSVFRDAVRGLATSARVIMRNNRERGGNLLHVACAHSHPHILRYLLTLDEFADSVEEMNDSGKTPVFTAIRHGSLECLKLLVDAGANIYKKDIENWTALHEAVKAGDNGIDFVEYLISGCDMDVNAVDDDGWTPLHVAARFSSTKAVDVLVRAGSNVNATTEDKETPMLLASAQTASAEVLRKLLAHGADLSMHQDSALTPTRLLLGRRDFKQLCILLDHLKTLDEPSRRQFIDLASRSETGDSLLHVCVQQKSAEATEKLLGVGAEPNEKNHEGIAPLHIACKIGEVAIVRILLQGGANPNIVRGDGMRPIHIACDGGEVDVVASLIEAKCDTNVKIEDAVRHKGFSPLMFASRLGNTDITSMLIKSGANLDCAKSDGFTALHLAALNGNTKVCRLLIDAGADYRAADESGYPPMQLAIQQSRLDVVSTMLEANVDPDCCANLGLTALHVASYVCDVRLIWLLIRGGADLNAVNSDRATPLHVAASREQGSVSMQLLLANGAKTEMRDIEENTPLHNACYRGLYQNVKLLLRREAEPSPVNENRVTPLHFAAAGGCEQCVEALLKHGADVEARDNRSLTPYRVASEHGHRQVMILLFRAMKISLAEIAPKKMCNERSSSGSYDDVLCVICRNPLSEGESTRTLPCGHSYHDDCILIWLGGEDLLRHDSCPLCLKSVLPNRTTPRSSTRNLPTPPE